MLIDGFVRAQTLWDETMAESVARYLASPAGKDKHLLVVAGGYHVESGFGIPRRVFRRFPASYLLIGGREIDVPADKESQMMNITLPEYPMVPYDFLAFISYETLPETGVRLGVMVEQAKNRRGLLVKSVVPGSNAARAGLKPGDLLLTLDGEALADNFDLVYAVRRKHAGDHGSLQFDREGQIVTTDVLFQAPGEKHPHDKR
jgi:S1-C subfamily serine protease